MVYRVIGLMSGSSLDGLDIAFVELHENAGKWSYNFLRSACNAYSNTMADRLRDAHRLQALDYQQLHIDYGHYLGVSVNDFITFYNLHHQVHLVVSHGHTTFHLPEKLMTAQLGDGAAVAAETGLPVVSDLRSLDVAFGGQGAPIVPMGERLLFADYDLCLNLGGIANISAKGYGGQEGSMLAFDICPANRVLNMLAEERQLSYDEDGNMAAAGTTHAALLEQLNSLAYYNQPFPKSLSNTFGTEIIYPMIRSFSLPVEDALHTYVEHIVLQIHNAILHCRPQPVNSRLLVTGGGALNRFMMKKLKETLFDTGITITVPENEVIQYKEALIMALLGTLRWREEYTTLPTVTGARRSSIGGALWLGTEA